MLKLEVFFEKFSPKFFLVKNVDSQKQSEVEGFGLKRIHWRNMGNSDESSNEGSGDESFGNKSKRAKFV